MDSAELMDARLDVREEREQSTVDRVKTACIVQNALPLNFTVPNCPYFSFWSVSVVPAVAVSDADVHGWSVSPHPRGADLPHHA